MDVYDNFKDYVNKSITLNDKIESALKFLDIPNTVETIQEELRQQVADIKIAQNKIKAIDVATTASTLAVVAGATRLLEPDKPLLPMSSAPAPAPAAPAPLRSTKGRKAAAARASSAKTKKTSSESRIAKKNLLSGMMQFNRNAVVEAKNTMIQADAAVEVAEAKAAEADDAAEAADDGAGVGFKRDAPRLQATGTRLESELQTKQKAITGSTITTVSPSKPKSVGFDKLIIGEKAGDIDIKSRKSGAYRRRHEGSTPRAIKRGIYGDVIDESTVVPKGNENPKLDKNGLPLSAEVLGVPSAFKFKKVGGNKTRKKRRRRHKILAKYNKK